MGKWVVGWESEGWFKGWFHFFYFFISIFFFSIFFFSSFFFFLRTISCKELDVWCSGYWLFFLLIVFLILSMEEGTEEVELVILLVLW